MDTMKLIQIVYLTILSAASVAATRVVAASPTQKSLACYTQPPCSPNPPPASMCLYGSTPWLTRESCWACCYWTS
ncbi:hypothetical protein BDR04DRAFT_1098667 [Suillus decipiens]|nr:hypothetical protein BDR04DRAFT_1098667 [Suillus decipiens]